MCCAARSDRCRLLHLHSDRDHEQRQRARRACDKLFKCWTGVAAPTPRRPHPASKRDAHRGARSPPPPSRAKASTTLVTSITEMHILMRLAGERCVAPRSSSPLIYGPRACSHLRSQVVPRRSRERLCRQRVSSVTKSVRISPQPRLLRHAMSPMSARISRKRVNRGTVW